jgi:steroid delta-isomerase-like uncharacterized protein
MEGDMSHTDSHKQGHEAFNNRDFEALTQNMADDAVWTDHARGLELKGKQQIVGWLKGWTEAFSDARVTDAQFLDAGDVSIATFTAQGTNDGAVQGLPGKGKRMSARFCEILHYDDQGRMTRGESFYDNATIMRQAGVDFATKPSRGAERQPVRH